MKSRKPFNRVTGPLTPNMAHTSCCWLCVHPSCIPPAEVKNWVGNDIRLNKKGWFVLREEMAVRAEHSKDRARCRYTFEQDLFWRLIKWSKVTAVVCICIMWIKFITDDSLLLESVFDRTVGGVDKMCGLRLTLILKLFSRIFSIPSMKPSLAHVLASIFLIIPLFSPHIIPQLKHWPP